MSNDLKTEPPACNVKGGNGTCTSGLTQDKKNRFCIGGDRFCGVNLQKEKTCNDMLTSFGAKNIKCNAGYSPNTTPITQGTQKSCLFTCDKATPPSSDKWTCDKTNYKCSQDKDGKYSSKDDCTKACVKPQPPPPPSSAKYNCDGNYSCFQDNNGPFKDQADCTSKCVKSSLTTPCNVQGGHGTCVSDLTPAGNRFCIGGDKLCGINLHEGKTCDDMVNQYGSDYIKCKDGYSVKSKQITQGNQKSCILSCERPKITGELLLKMGGVVALFIIVWLLILFVITRSASRRMTQSGFMM
jgi:hypothetical protein